MHRSTIINNIKKMTNKNITPCATNLNFGPSRDNLILLSFKKSKKSSLGISYTGCPEKGENQNIEKWKILCFSLLLYEYTKIQSKQNISTYAWFRLIKICDKNCDRLEHDKFPPFSRLHY